MSGFDAFELYTDIIRYEDGRCTVTYSMTPKQLIRHLKKHKMHVWIAEGVCRECNFTPERVVHDSHVREMERMYVQEGIVPECVIGAVARYRQRSNVPDCVYCYGFYYQHWAKNIFLQALKEAGLISFWNTDDMESVRESGLTVTGYPL